MTSTSGGDRDQLVKDLEQARNELRASYQGLSDEQMTRPGAVGEWSVKDVLTHVVSWEEITLPDLERVARGDTPTLASFDPKKVDDWNAMIMSIRRNLPLDQVLRELDISHADLMVALGRLPDPVLAEGQFARGMLTICAAHDREHTEDIRQWRQREGL
jgi:hypothetical protein